ncbi:MAG TPA: tryptophan 2,3-dioxygenase family protein [Caulobacteraceae bacterium]|jgi:tryptophan 2,3-dioxygenase
MSDPADDGLHLSPDLSYGGYLELERILSSQHPRSGQHDEMLFIIIHQASELWMKLSIHELTAARDHIAADDLPAALKMIARVGRIQTQMIQSWDVLATLTPSEYRRIRPSLGQSSGFQSYQYRQLDFILGVRREGALKVHEATPAIHALLSKMFAEPSLYDEAVRLLSRRGFAIPAEDVERDWRAPHADSAAVEAAWLAIYRDPEGHWDLYELAEKLVDLEYRFQQWRFAHLKTVERIIGGKAGTGGSQGLTYLAKALDTHFFPELLKVRTSL